MTTTLGSALPAISSSPKMQHLLELIKQGDEAKDIKHNKDETKYYEHRVASWGVTMANKVFSGDQWIFTPEKLNTRITLDAEYKNFTKKPDYTIEHFHNAAGKIEITPVLLMEFKSRTGDRFEQALKQTVEHLSSYMHDQNTIDIYIVIIRDTKIGFFEFHGNTEDVEGTVESIWGCTSLTQPLTLEGEEQITMQNVPNDLLPVYYNVEKLKTEDEIRTQAKKYKVPCVFDLEKHGEQIDFLFHHMSTNKPRAGPDFCDLPSDNDDDDNGDSDDADSDAMEHWWLA